MCASDITERENSPLIVSAHRVMVSLSFVFPDSRGINVSVGGTFPEAAFVDHEARGDKITFVLLSIFTFQSSKETVFHDTSFKEIPRVYEVSLRRVFGRPIST